MVIMHGELVILEVQKHPCLYDPEVHQYKSREERKEAWKSVSMNIVGEKKWNDMGEETQTATIKEVMNRWRHMKDNYIKNVKLMEASKIKSTKPPKPYMYHEQFAFLHVPSKPKKRSFKKRFVDNDVNEESESTLSLDSSVEEKFSPVPQKRKANSFEEEIVIKPKVNVVQPSPATTHVVQSSPGPSVAHLVPGPNVAHLVPGPSVVQPAAVPDPDEMFLLSQLPIIKQLNPANKLNFQVEFLQLLQSYATTEDS